MRIDDTLYLYFLPLYLTQGVVLTLCVVAIAALVLRRWWHGFAFTALIAFALPLLSGESLFDLPKGLVIGVFVALALWFSLIYGLRHLLWWAVQKPQRFVLLLAGVAAVPVVAVSFATLAPSITPAPVVEVVQWGRDALAPPCAETTQQVFVPPLPTFDDAPLSGMLPSATDPAFADVPTVSDDQQWDHFIGPVEFIRVPSLSAAGFDDRVTAGIELALVIGVDGDVVAIKPLSGPPSLHGEATRIARRWKFRPFVIDGKASRVRIEGFVSVGTPVKSARRVAFPEIEDWESVSIRVSGRVHGFGGQDYDLEIRGDGSVTYYGYGGVALLGRHCAVTARADVDKLIDAFRKAEFFSLNDRYQADAFDFNSTTLTLSFDGHSKTVFDYASFFLPNTPDAVSGLPILVNQAGYGHRWTKGNEFTAASLVAEYWDFSRVDRANRLMVAGAASYGDANTVRTLIAAGAPVSTEGAGNGWNPLEAAAQRGDAEMARALLSSGARWSRDQLSSVFPLITRLGDTPLVDTLLARGADINWRDREGKTPLMAAAEAGTAAVVERLLRAKANVHVVDNFRRTALHQAVSGRLPNLKIPAGEDVRRVVELLLGAGADVNARDEFGRTPLFSEWRYGEDAARLLIARGADVNAQDTVLGLTPLMVCRNPEVTEVLLEAGADPYTKDHSQKTALDHARSGENSGAAAVLQRWMTRHAPRKQ